MKKIISIALAVVLMLSLCSCGNDGEEIPFDECRQIAAGLWIDPLNRAPSVMLNQDGTASFLDETFTWDVTWSDKDPEDNKWRRDAFFLSLYDDAGNQKYELLFEYYYDEQLWRVLSLDTARESTEDYPFSDYHLFKEDSVEIIKVNEDTFGDYFELIQIFEWKTEERKDWSFNAYLVIKPEYEKRAVDTNWKTKINCTVERRKYNVFIDAENDIMELLDVRDPDSEPIIFNEEIELDIIKRDYAYKDGYLSLDFIYMPKDYSNNEYVYVAEYYSISPLSYTLLLKK